MIRTDKEYNELKERLSNARQLLDEQRKHLENQGLSEKEVERALQPTVSFQNQQFEELAFYEGLKKGKIPECFRSFSSIGKLLIASRIAQGLTQKELADRLNVKESVISRDEKNEYHGITAERAQRIADALNIKVELRAAVCA